MVKIHTIIGGPEEEKDPLLLCGICEALPELEVQIYDSAVQFCFSCPKCGNHALIWHVDMEKMIECQNCGTWFTVTHNYGEAAPPEERKGKVKE